MDLTANFFVVLLIASLAVSACSEKNTDTATDTVAAPSPTTAPVTFEAGGTPWVLPPGTPQPSDNDAGSPYR